MCSECLWHVPLIISFICLKYIISIRSFWRAHQPEVSDLNICWRTVWNEPKVKQSIRHSTADTTSRRGLASTSLEPLKWMNSKLVVKVLCNHYQWQKAISHSKTYAFDQHYKINKCCQTQQPLPCKHCAKLRPKTIFNFFWPNDLTWVQNLMVSLADHLAGTSKTKIQLQSNGKTQQLKKTSNINKTKPKETKAWFRLSFMPSTQEADCVYSTAVMACTGQNYHNNKWSVAHCHTQSITGKSSQEVLPDSQSTINSVSPLHALQKQLFKKIENSVYEIPISKWSFARSFRLVFGWRFTGSLMSWRGFVAQNARSLLWPCGIFIHHWSDSFHLWTSEWRPKSCACRCAAANCGTFRSTYKNGISH